MTPEQKAAYINSQVACANAKMQTMIADNQKSLAGGGSVFWTSDHFESIPDDFGISHNAVISFFMD